MPKIINYPVASWKKSLELAEAIDSLGGESSLASCAAKLGKKPRSGGFSYIIRAAVKFGLVENKKGELQNSALFNKIKTSYKPEEVAELKQNAFLSPPLYREIFEKFKNKQLPVDIFEKVLASDFEVPRTDSKRVAGYFIQGAREVGLLGADNHIKDSKNFDEADYPLETEQVAQKTSNSSAPETKKTSDKFTLTLIGPGINLSFGINSERDLNALDFFRDDLKRRLEQL